MSVPSPIPIRIVISLFWIRKGYKAFRKHGSCHLKNLSERQNRDPKASKASQGQGFAPGLESPDRTNLPESVAEPQVLKDQDVSPPGTGHARW
jgi:hypothetical protein